MNAVALPSSRLRVLRKRLEVVAVVAVVGFVNNGCVHRTARPVAISSRSIGSISTIAGGAAAPFTISANARELWIDGAAGIAVDGDGNIYVAAFLANRILKIDREGRGSLVAGNGAPTSAGDGGPADKASVYGPSAIALDGGSLFIAEQLGDRVRRVDLASGQIFTLRGGLSQPAGIAIHRGNVYVTEFAGNCLSVISATGELKSLAGSGQRVSAGDGGAASAASFAGPTGIAIDSEGRVYVAEVFAHSIRRIDSDGTIRTVLGGTEKPGVALSRPTTGTAPAATLRWPQSLLFDQSGNLLVTDFAAGLVYALGVNGATTPLLTAEEGTDGIWGIAMAQSGELYVTSFNAGSISRSSPTGTREVIAGARRRTEAIIAAGEMHFKGISGLGVDSSGRVFISEALGHRVWALREQRLTLFSGTGLASSMGDRGRAQTATLNHPVGIIPAPDGVYIVEAEGHRIRRVGSDGVIETIAGIGRPGFSGDGGSALGASLAHPHYGVIVGEFGASSRTGGKENGFLVFVDTDNHRVRRIGTDGRIETIAGTGRAESSGDGGVAREASLNRPEAVVADSAGNLYVSEAHRVRKIDTKGIITTFAGNGQRGFAGMGGPAVGATMDSPYGLAIDGSDVYIADSWNNVVWRVDAKGIATVIAGTTRKSSDGDGGPARRASLNAPVDLAIHRRDGEAFLLIAELEGSRVRSVRLR